MSEAFDLIVKVCTLYLFEPIQLAGPPVCEVILLQKVDSLLVFLDAMDSQKSFLWWNAGGVLDKNSFESNSCSLGYAKKGGAMFVQWLLLLSW